MKKHRNSPSFDFRIFERVKTVVVGNGNLAWCLVQALHESSDIELVQVMGRNPATLKEYERWAPVNTNWADLKEADVYLLAVTDQAIPKLSEQYNNKGIWVHCSGSTSIEVFNEKVRAGVFYPLQTFTKGRKLSFTDIPIGLEARSEEDYRLLEKLAKTLSSKVFRMSSQQRQKMHLAAVWANNFSNHLFARSAEMSEAAGIPGELLLPLIDETIQKLKELGAKAAQTGPARRGDHLTINKHLDMLTDPLVHKIHEQISLSIEEYHSNDQ